MEDPDRARLLARLEKYTVKELSCWEWVGPKSPKGYGKIQLDDRHLRAHRVVWELHYGPLTAELHVMHMCDNPSCVNPTHLTVGTNAENMRDRDAKGKMASGERHGMAKLSDTVRKEIQEKLFEGKNSMRSIAKAYGVSLGCVSNIKYRKLL